MIILEEKYPQYNDRWRVGLLMLTMDRIRQAQKILAPVVDRTAVLHADGLCPAEQVLLKAENLQKTGSFKVRGAYFRISQLTGEEKARGVIACSAGNHAQGVALAAKEEGLRCVICMPEHSPISKIERTRALDAQVVLVPGGFDDAADKMRELQRLHGYTVVHPFDHPDIIAGQATVGLEILEQAPRADMVLVPVGGGGLIAGVAYAIKQLRPSCEVIGVQASQMPSMKVSLEEGHVCAVDRASTIADGIAVGRVGDEPFALCRQYVDRIVTVKEGEIASAILHLLENQKTVAEGAGAAAVAAVLYGKVDTRDRQVVCVVSGGNVDVNILAQIIHKGLKKTGRVIAFDAVVEDRPNRLRALLDVPAQLGANILSISHDREDVGLDVGRCRVRVTLETKGNDHAKRILDELRERHCLE